MSIRPSKLQSLSGDEGIGIHPSSSAPDHDDSNSQVDESKKRKSHTTVVSPMLPSRRGVILFIIFCLVAAIALHVIKTANLLLELVPHHFKDCRVVLGPVGAEDIALDSRGVTIISSDARFWVPLSNRDGFTDGKEAHKRMAQLTQEQQGAIWAYDSRSKQNTITPGQMKKLNIIDYPWASLPDFHPHGICIPRRGPLEASPSAADPTYVYVANHARTGDQILVLRVHYTQSEPQSSFPSHLSYVTMMQSPGFLKGINDLACLYPTELPGGGLLHTVYVSNLMGSDIGDTFWNLVELFTSRPWGSVVACQTETIESNPASAIKNTYCQTVIKDLVTPNGVALSPNNQFLYVALTTPMDVLVYEMPPSVPAIAKSKDEEKGQTLVIHGNYRVQPLHYNDTIHTGTGVDNIDIDPVTGDLFIGSHIKPLQFTAHHQDRSNRAPSHVIRIHPAHAHTHDVRSLSGDAARVQLQSSNPIHAAVRAQLVANGENPIAEVDEIHLSLGEKFSASSVGVWSRQSNELIIGAVNDEGLFICPYPAHDQMKRS